MGTDIHIAIQFTSNGQTGWLVPGGWETRDGKFQRKPVDADHLDIAARCRSLPGYREPDWKERWDDEKELASKHVNDLRERYYARFAILANVRNGFGFAGVPTGDALPFIQEGRGFPEGFQADSTGAFMGSWMGDHSFGYVTAQELLDYDFSRSNELTGVIPASYFEEMQAKGETVPDSYSGAVWGPSISTYPSPEAYLSAHPVPGSPPVDAYVRVRWTMAIRDTVGHEFVDETIPWLASLSDEPSDTFVIFGFDS